MSWIDYETEIENQVEAKLLLGGNTSFQVERYFETVSPDELVEYVQGKTKTVPVAFLRCEGYTPEQISTLGETSNSTITLSVIVSSPNLGKERQISGEKRHVNTIIKNLMNRMSGSFIELTDQPPQPVVFKGVKDLFTTKSVDVRMISLEVQGVMIDL